MDLSRVARRNELKLQREPHWQRLRTGVYLGFRRSAKGGPGTWIARVYDGEASKYKLKSLGDFGALLGNEMFAAAKREAETFADLVETGGIENSRAKIETVKDACEDYAKLHADAKGRFERLVYGSSIAKLKLAKLRKSHLEDWRTELERTPAQISRSKGSEMRTRNRAPATINRDIVPLRAALSKVLAPGTPGTSSAWQEALKPIKNADSQRTLYLIKTERTELLSKVEGDAQPFIRALSLLPLRPGAMANLNVSDFDKKTRELTVSRDKTGKPRRILVPQKTAAFLSDVAGDRPPNDALFKRQNGKRWTKNDWNAPLKLAAISAKMDPTITAYTLRHSLLTDLVNDGLPILTVAQLSDTSVEMIERHYGHLNKVAAEQALAKLVP